MRKDKHKSKGQGLHRTDTPGICRVCGCTDATPCIDGGGYPCAWADKEHTLCTACEGKE